MKPRFGGCESGIALKTQVPSYEKYDGFVNCENSEKPSGV